MWLLESWDSPPKYVVLSGGAWGTHPTTRTHCCDLIVDTFKLTRTKRHRDGREAWTTKTKVTSGMVTWKMAPSQKELKTEF
jgi:hypothetical protein